MKIDTVWFKDRVRVDGNTFLNGVTPGDSKRWTIRLEREDRVVLLRGEDKAFKGQVFAVPFENVSAMRLVEDTDRRVLEALEMERVGLLDKGEADRLITSVTKKK